MWESEREVLELVEKFVRSRRWRYTRTKRGASICVHQEFGAVQFDIYLGRFEESGSKSFVALANWPFTFDPDTFSELERGADLVNPILEPIEIAYIYHADQVMITNETKYAGKLSDLVVARTIFSTLFFAQSLFEPITMISDGRATAEAMLYSLLKPGRKPVC